MLSFGAEFFVFQNAIKKFKYKDIYIYIYIYRTIILPVVLYECVTWSLALEGKEAAGV